MLRKREKNAGGFGTEAAAQLNAVVGRGTDRAAEKFRHAREMQVKKNAVVTQDKRFFCLIWSFCRRRCSGYVDTSYDMEVCS